MSHPYFAGTRYPRVLAHRGLVPSIDGEYSLWENSIGAFAAAHAAGVEYIETDCQVTADGDVVLIHDPTLERLSGDPRAVSQVRTAELSRLFADHGGLMTVADALDSFPDTRFNLDVKSTAAAERVGPLLTTHTHRVLVTSFSEHNRLTALASVMRAGARIPPATSGSSRVILLLRMLSQLRMSPARVLRNVDAVQIPERHAGIQLFTPTLVRAAQRCGAEVHVWTVNEASAMKRLVAGGADGIVTDRADLALQTL